MKKLALCLLISFSCTLQAMENIKEAANQKFIYAICLEKEASKTWHEISREMVTFESSEGTPVDEMVGLYKLFQKDICTSMKDIDVSQVTHIINGKSMPPLSEDVATQFVEMITNAEEIDKNRQAK